MKKIKVRVKNQKVLTHTEALEICRASNRVEFITGHQGYDDSKKMWFDVSCVFCKGKKYILMRDCGAIVYCKEM